MKNKLKKILALMVLVPAIFLSGCGQKKVVEKEYKVNLEVWGLLDNSESFSAAVKAYREINPHIGSIRFRKFTQDNYKKELESAMSEGNAPDIFLIQNSWLPEFSSKMEPAPDFMIGMDEIKSNFVDTVQTDLISAGKIYALPLSVDSLALYYNKDLFNAAEITQPPTNWEEFENYVQKITRKNAEGKIEIAGAAIGTAYNINRSTDLFSMLVMQNGGNVVSKDGARSELDMMTRAPNGETSNLGEMALRYYTRFADPDSEFYTWNNESHYSIDAFSEGKTAMMFNYSWHINTIKSKNAKLNFDIAPVPQAYQAPYQVNFANYWAFGVSRFKVLGKDQNNAVRIQEAWQFLKFLTMANQGSFKVYNAYSETRSFTKAPVSIDPASEYIEKTKRPAARRDLIEKQKTDPVLGPFAKGNLIARSFYQKNVVATEKSLEEMIDTVTRGGASTEDAIYEASNKISDSLK